MDSFTRFGRQLYDYIGGRGACNNEKWPVVSVKEAFDSLEVVLDVTNFGPAERKISLENGCLNIEFQASKSFSSQPSISGGNQGDLNGKGLGDFNAPGPGDFNAKGPGDSNAKGPGDFNARGPGDINAKGAADNMGSVVQSQSQGVSYAYEGAKGNWQSNRWESRKLYLPSDANMSSAKLSQSEQQGRLTLLVTWTPALIGLNQGHSQGHRQDISFGKSSSSSSSSFSGTITF